MELEQEIRRTHSDLCEEGKAFLDYVQETCERGSVPALKAPALPDWVPRYTMLEWPVLLDARKRQELNRASAAVTRLVKSIPDRIFDRDPAAIARAYGLGSPSLLALMLEPPDGLDEAIVRCDLIDSRDGLRCIEVNISTRLGGWDHRLWQTSLREHPPIAEFLERQRIEVHYQDPFEALFLHMARRALAKGICDDGEVNIGIRLGPPWKPNPEGIRPLTELLGSVLAQLDPALRGEILTVGGSEPLNGRKGKLFYDDTRVHAILEFTEDPTPLVIQRCFKAGALHLYNSTLANILGDKRSFAFLWEGLESGKLTPEEARLVERYLPWSRRVVPGVATFRGSSATVAELAVAHREQLVLKPAAGSGGSGVLLGRWTASQDWEQAVQKAVREAPSWIVQEVVESRPYSFVDEGRLTLHDAVWGIFSFGEDYGGGFLRIMPRGVGGGIINAHRGAVEAVMLEVKEGAGRVSVPDSLEPKEGLLSGR